MKKFLSILLALSLIISVIPAAFAETTGEVPTSKTYELYDLDAKSNISFKSTTKTEGQNTIEREISGTPYYLRDEYWLCYDNFNYGDRGWGIFYASDDTVAARFRLDYANDYLEVGSSAGRVSLDFALSLQAPAVAGFYTAEMQGGVGTSTKNVKWYLDVFSSEKSIDNYKETEDVVFSGSTSGVETVNTAKKAIYSKAGDEIISAMYEADESYWRFRYIKFDQILNPVMTTVIKNDNDSTTSALSLNLVDNKQQTVTLHTTVKGKDTEGADVEPIQVSNNFITYKSSNEAVATVAADGTITAVGGGEATIYAESSDGKYNSQNSGITVTVTAPAAEPEEDEELTNAFDDAVKADAPSDYIAPTVDAIDAEGILGEPVPVAGGAYKITAPETAGDRGNFLYWKKAMAVNEKIVSFEEEFNYVPESEERNILVAVYEGDINLDAPKCYNANGQYIPDAQPIDADLPSMAGYGKAYKWEQYKDTNVWVAQYEAETPIADIDVTVTGDNTSGGGTNLAFGAEVTCKATGENFKCWKKTYGDGTAKIVSTDAEYTFNAWEDCTVTAIYEEHTYTGSKMKIIIDSFAAGEETGVMAEFLGFGNNVVEKGIMFEDNRIAMTTVGNQFSVIADEKGTYKGYVIVEDTDGLKLITDGSYTK